MSRWKKSALLWCTVKTLGDVVDGDQVLAIIEGQRPDETQDLEMSPIHRGLRLWLVNPVFRC